VVELVQVLVLLLVGLVGLVVSPYLSLQRPHELPRYTSACQFRHAFSLRATNLLWQANPSRSSSLFPFTTVLVAFSPAREKARSLRNTRSKSFIRSGAAEDSSTRPSSSRLHGARSRCSPPQLAVSWACTRSP